MEKVTRLRSLLEKEYGLFGVDEVVLDKAMTTKSFTKERFDKGEVSSPDGYDYQELELIGDKVIGLVVAEHLMLVGTKTEGKLTEEISSIVDNENLKRISHNLGLHQFVNIGNNQQILDTKVEADIFESLAGAIYFSLGFLIVKRFLINTLFSESVKKEIGFNDDLVFEVYTKKKNILQMLREKQNHSKGSKEIKLDNVKNELQEICQKYGLSIPRYEVVDKRGSDHKPMFIVEVFIDGEYLGKGQGTSIKHAEKFAAIEAYSVMNKRFNEGKM